MGDQTRRDILATLLNGPRAVNEIAERFRVSRPAISQHLKILKEAKLVTDRQDGNRRLYELNRAGFASLRAYLDRFGTDTLDIFTREVEQTNANETEEDRSWRAW